MYTYVNREGAPCDEHGCKVQFPIKLFHQPQPSSPYVHVVNYDLVYKRAHHWESVRARTILRRDAALRAIDVQPGEMVAIYLGTGAYKCEGNVTLTYGIPLGAYTDYIEDALRLPYGTPAPDGTITVSLSAALEGEIFMMERSLDEA